MLPVPLSVLCLTKGVRYGTPKLRSPARCDTVRYTPVTIPKIPRYPPKNKKKYLSIRNAEANSSFGIAREPSAVIATTMTTIGLTRFASTAAEPTISPPTIPIAFPNAPGIRTPASRISSKDNSSRTSSAMLENGTPSLAWAKDRSIFVGRICV